MDEQLQQLQAQVAAQNLTIASLQLEKLGVDPECSEMLASKLIQRNTFVYESGRLTLKATSEELRQQYPRMFTTSVVEVETEPQKPAKLPSPYEMAERARGRGKH